MYYHRVNSEDDCLALSSRRRRGRGEDLVVYLGQVQQRWQLGFFQTEFCLFSDIFYYLLFGSHFNFVQPVSGVAQRGLGHPEGVQQGGGGGGAGVHELLLPGKSIDIDEIRKGGVVLTQPPTVVQ